MKKDILKIIETSNGKITFGSLINKVDVSSEELEKILLELRLDGKILKVSNRYSLFPNEMMIGNISLTHSGNKVIFYDGKMISLASNFFDNVILNDVVSFYINDKNEAVITSIIDRKIHDVTCKVIAKGKKKKIECFYRGIDVTLPDNITKDFKDGDIILVNIGLNNEDSHHCECTFKRLIGHANDPNIDEVIIAANYGFDNEYSNEYLDELAMIPSFVSESDCVGRVDLRDLPFVTIDCVTAKDMDDGVYAYKFKNGGYRVYVTIADVSHFVKIGSELFKRAYEKGNSCYINNTVFHMLHQIISNGICSLNPLEDRLTKTVIMDIDNKGNIIDYDICKSVIKSRKKMDYASVDKLLVDGEIPSGYEEYVDLLKTLNEVAKILEVNAIENGRLDFPSSENIKEYDEFGNVIKVIDNKIESSPSEKLIEHLMIAANRSVGNYILSCWMSSVYRVHKSANVKKVNNVLKEINDNNDIDVKFKLIDSAEHPKVIQAILKKLSHLEEYPILASILLQSIERAEYSTENIGHYALGLDVYTHFTSPIRRLCDLMVHMILDVLISDGDLLEKIDFTEFETFLQDLSKQASRMERQAEAAEYDGDRLAIIKSMEKFIGFEYNAVVMDVSDRIRLKVNGLDCFIRYKNLSEDFIYDESSRKYYDRNNDMILKLGAKVKVILTNVNLNTRSIDVDITGIINSKKLIKK